MVDGQNGVSRIYTPSFVVLFIGAQKQVPLILGNPHIVVSQHKPGLQATRTHPSTLNPKP